MTMTRSRTQVLRGYLPGQTFQHEDGPVVRTYRVSTNNARVDLDILFDNLGRQLDRWRLPIGNRAESFPELPRNVDRYDVLDPVEQAYFDVWPLLLRCTRTSCEKAVYFRDSDAWAAVRSPARCDLCGARREQMPYIQVHGCGRDAPLLEPPRCSVHGDRHVYLKDVGSFIDSAWRCRAPGCNGRYLRNMGQRGCSCGIGGHTYTSRTVRQEDRFITHTVAFVNFARENRLRLQGAAGRDKVIAGCYLGLIDDYEQALLDADKDDDAKVAARWLAVEKTLRENETSEDDIEMFRRRMVNQSQGAFSEVTALLAPEVCGTLADEQEAFERTLIFADAHAGRAGRLRVARLGDLRSEAVDAGRHSAVTVIDDASVSLRDAGFSDMLVIENFPVALCAYGFTRLGRTPETAMLTPFRHDQRALIPRIPVYTVATETEAIFFELDAERVLRWAVMNGWMDAVDLDEDARRRAAQAKAAVLRETLSGGLLADRVKALQHTLAHALIRNMGERSGFGENTMAEYLLPRFLTFGLYADTHQEFSLGALMSLAENRLREWLEVAMDGARACDWDPECGRGGGACMGCLHLSFGCQEFNGSLNRAMLFGSPAGDPDGVAHGFWG
jgi:hypothetical protein